MEKITVADLYDQLIDLNLFTEEELQLITCINGFTVETLNDCIFARYGYRDLQQILEYEEEEE